MNIEQEVQTALEELEAVSRRLRRILSASSDDDSSAEGLRVFDPDVDEPTETPLVSGSRVQRDWCSVMLWSQLRAINVRQSRGATKEEVVEIAKSSGYSDGRGWNRWTGWEDLDDGRWVTTDGMGHLAHYFGEIGRSLPDDLK